MQTHIKKIFANTFSGSNIYVLCSLLVVVTGVITIILYPNLVSDTYSYNLGDVARRDVKALTDFLIEDTETTEENRKQAVGAVLTIYDHDTGLADYIAQRVHNAFFSLRSIIESENGTKEGEAGNTGTGASDTPPPAGKKKKPIHDQIWDMRTAFEERLGIAVTDGEYKILEKEKFSIDIENFMNQIVREVLSNGLVGNKDLLLRESDKGIILRNLETKEEELVKTEKRMRQFYGPDQAKSMVRIIGKPLLKDASYTVRDLTVDLVQRLLPPNITLNKSETEDRKKKAAENVKPVLYKIKAGEMLLREGEIVTKVQLLKLKALHAQTTKTQLLISGIGTAMLILILLSIFYTLHIKRKENTFRNTIDLLFLGVVLLIFIFFTRMLLPITLSSSYMIFGVPVAAGAMTVCLFMGMDIAVPFAMILSVCIAILFKNKFDIFIYFFLSSIMAAYWIQGCRERKAFIKAGLKLGILNAALAASVDIYLADFTSLSLMWDCSFGFMGGVVAGLIAIGIAPLIEIVFGYTTDIKLLELANLDQPILRRLMIEAPGTYHHSVVVGTMVEAAASAIGANPLLARVCAYYHDIGKVKKPLYFIENQRDGKNRHDKLAPSMSSLILIEHIKAGVEIAREYRLGQAITDAIKQHHGTSLISFFYDKAKQLKGEDAVKIEDFRYPGPKPLTKEAGLVMLADVLEAASRTLENPTPSRVQGLVQNLINKVFSDGQLDACELTLKDLNNIAKSYTNILNGIYHHRIEYPEKPVSNGKEKNGSSDTQQSKHPDKDGGDTEKGAGRLKRLGLS